MAVRKQDPIDWNLKEFLQNRYSIVPKSDLEKILNSILDLIEFSRDRKRDVRSILDQAAKMIFRVFDFDEIAIGLKDPRDGLYRYEILFGFTKNTEMAFRRLEYTSDDMVSYDKYPFVKIGRLSELNPVEGISESDKHLYDRPLAIGAPRSSPEDFLEGDYIDLWMYNDAKDLIGWFEVSKPRSRKMPSSDTIRWIEVIVDICALIVQRKGKYESAKP